MNLSLKKKKQVRNSYRKEKTSRWAFLRTVRLSLPRLSLPRGGLVNVLTLCVLLLFVAAVVTDIDVTGNVRLSRDMVLKYGGLHEGDNSLSVSITEMERKLRATPWVEEVSVKRLLPDRFIIRIRERMPSFWVHKDGVLYYANERGEIIAPVESENFLSLPTLSVESGGEEAIPFLERLMADLNSGSLPVESGAIASVTLSPARGVEVYLEDREMRLSIAIDDWSGNLTRLGATLSDLARRQELRNVRDVRAVHGNVWVILNENVRG